MSPSAFGISPNFRFESIASRGVRKGFGALQGTAFMSHSVRSHLGVEVSAYDQAIRRFIPGYDVMLSVAAEQIVAARPTRALDLGAGTGALSQAVLERAAGSGFAPAVTLLDVDPEMIDQARARLARFAGSVFFRRQSYHDPLPSCDAAYSSLALHHVPRMAEKRRLYERVHEVLPAGGVFVNADAVMPADPAEQAVTYERWAAHMVGQGIARGRALEHFAEWADEDTYHPLEEELAAVDAAGFGAECAWREGPMAVVVGRKRLVRSPSLPPSSLPGCPSL